MSCWLLLWSARLGRHVRSLLVILRQKLLLSESCRLWHLFDFVLPEIYCRLRLRLRNSIWLSNTVLFLRLELAARWSRNIWFRWLVWVKSNLDKLIKRKIRAEAKRNKLKKIIKILIGKDAILNTLKLTIQINSPFEDPNFRSIPVTGNEPANLNLASLVSIEHIKQIIDKGLPL